jgi:hypothetical protein
MQLMRVIKQKIDTHKQGNKYGNLPKTATISKWKNHWNYGDYELCACNKQYLPNNELASNNLGYFSAGYEMRVERLIYE